MAVGQRRKSMVHKLKEPIAALEIGGEVGTRAYSDVYSMPLAGRLKRFAVVFGIKKNGVNLTELKPGAASSEFHFHTRQDEFVYVLEGEPRSQKRIKIDMHSIPLRVTVTWKGEPSSVIRSLCGWC